MPEPLPLTDEDWVRADFVLTILRQYPLGEYPATTREFLAGEFCRTRLAHTPDEEKK
jgi:hypothetical protein